MKGKFLFLLFALLVPTANARKTNGALDVLRRVWKHFGAGSVELKKDAGSMYYEYAVKNGVLHIKGSDNVVSVVVFTIM